MPPATLPPLPGLAGIPQEPSPTPPVLAPNDERRLLAATIYAESAPNEADMRHVLDTIVNRAKNKKQNVFDTLATPNQYVPTLPGQREAKFLPYIEGRIANPIQKKNAALAERLADEFLAGKFVPQTKDTSYRARNGVNEYYIEDKFRSDGDSANLRKYATEPAPVATNPEAGQAKRAKVTVKQGWLASILDSVFK